MYRKVAFLITLLSASLVQFCQAQSTGQPTTTPSQRLSLSYQTSFVFQGVQLEKYWEPHSALLIPIVIKQYPKVVYMQLDTGSPYTLLYGNKLKMLMSGSQHNTFVHDTLLPTFDFSIGGKAVNLSNVKVVRQTSEASTAPEERIIVGTLGMDLIDQHVLILDFPHQQFILSSSIPDSLQQRITLTDFYYSQRNILLPVLLQGQRNVVYFDSGASAFSLITDKTNWQKMVNSDSTAVSFLVSSWSKSLKVTTNATNERILVANQSLPIRRVAYMEGASQNQISQMQAMGISGLVGNQLFIENVLVIDTQQKKFGVYKPKQF